LSLLRLTGTNLKLLLTLLQRLLLLLDSNQT
jgi:hypothetical protein